MAAMEDGVRARTPLVLVHGVGLDHHLWDSTIAELAPGREVITFDLVGHGPGPHPPGPYSLDTFVEQLLAIVSGHPVVDLCGFSLGALISQAFAIAHGGRVRHLVLLGTVFQRTEDELRAIRERVAEVRAGGFPATVEAAIERWFSAEFSARAPEVVARIRATMEANDPSAYADAYGVFAVADTQLAPLVHSIGMPMLVIAGACDPRSTPAMSAALAAAVVDGRWAVVDGARHCFMVERPGVVAALIDGFLGPATLIDGFTGPAAAPTADTTAGRTAGTTAGRTAGTTARR